MRAIIHIYMEVPQKTLYAATLNKQKCHFFSFAKISGGKNGSCLGCWYQWEGEGVGERM
jgi:hypothetical protein